MAMPVALLSSALALILAPRKEIKYREGELYKRAMGLLPS